MTDERLTFRVERHTSTGWQVVDAGSRERSGYRGPGKRTSDIELENRAPAVLSAVAGI
ncbi:protein of unknown function [Modestobacter italicus]|uniref:Uncharacterized protein n=1 Tax=Modestobacter italicus (strain DSM 44449 / CECT 9708 / BC 501) TaxID=2732864 RepID=I4EUF8_MODI5|nr:protein of unknown function [Modestobacter marinus]